MKTVRQLLAVKGSGTHSVAPHTTVLEALRIMADKGIGALLVMEGTRLQGILSERDYARKVVLRGLTSHDLPVSEIMVRDVIAVHPDQTSEDCMELMTDKRIRHLPVIDGGRVVGVLSIGDLVKDIISEQSETIAQLEQYIKGG